MLRIYKSSAGSGKTYTLVKEFIRIALTEPNKFKHILAITFTNKAANEMKERVIQTLERIKSNNSKSQDLIADLAAELKMPVAEIVEKAGFILRNILHNYSDISVSTIDSFVHRVIRSFTYDLHLPMSFEVEMDRDKILAKTIEILMDQLNDEDDQLTNAIVEYAETNIEEGKSWNLEYSLINLGAELFNEDAYQHLDKLGDFDLTEIRKVRESLYQFSVAFEKTLFEEGKKGHNIIVSTGLTSNSFFQTTKGIYGFFSKYADEEIPNDPLGNSFVRKAIDEDKWTGGKASKGDVAVIDTIKDQLILHYKNITAHYARNGEDYELSKLLLKNFYAFILLADIQKVMSEYKKENNLLHISEFQKKIHAIVKEQDAPIIYERIGDRYDSILIDEHQDTSVLQWQNLLPLVENSQFKTETSLVVGDGKQAIYRFRNGKVEQFAVLPKVYGSENDMRLRERETAITNYGTETKNLSFNYRSRKQIVDFNNRFYDSLSQFPELRNKQIYEGHAQQQGRDADGGFISLEFLPCESEVELDEARCKRVAEIIVDVKAKGYDLKDVAVLTRSNKNGSLIASYLIEKGFPVVSSESLLINNSPRVKLLLSTLNYFDRKDDHIARAEIVYYIHLLLLGKDFRFEQFDFKAGEHLFEESISQLLGKEFHSYNFLSYQLVDLVQELMVFYGLSDDDPFLQFFVDELMVFTSRNRSNIREFLLWWAEKKHNKSIIYPETLDAVKLMTLHKSKGLQFPIVIMADADWPQKNSKRYFWIDIDKPWLKGLHVGILPVRKEVLKTEYAPLYEEEEGSSFLDLLNLVYVGTTRPEDMLYVLSAELKRDPVKNNSVTTLLINFLKEQSLWDGFHSYEFGNKDSQKLQSKSGEGIALYQKQKVNSVSKEKKAVSIRKNSRLLWNENTLGKIDLGNLMHEVLKRIKYAGDTEKVLTKMFNEGVIDDSQRKDLKAEISALINAPAIAPYFNLPYKVVNERPILGNRYTKVPDRVVTNGEEAVVIEFKTGEKDLENVRQVTDYIAELRKFGFNEVKGFLIYTADITIQKI